MCEIVFNHRSSSSFFSFLLLLWQLRTIKRGEKLQSRDVVGDQRTPTTIVVLNAFAIAMILKNVRSSDMGSHFDTLYKLTNLVFP